MNEVLDECIHGLGPISACTICNGRDQRERAERDRVLYTFPAQYISLLSCGHFSTIGEQIARRGDERLTCEACTP